MNNYYQYISDTIKPYADGHQDASPPLNIPEPQYLRQLRLDMEDFSHQLRTRFEQCAPGRDATGTMHVLRRKWIFEKREIKRLRDTCARLTRGLEAAMGPYALLVQRSVYPTPTLTRSASLHTSPSKVIYSTDSVPHGTTSNGSGFITQQTRSYTGNRSKPRRCWHSRSRATREK
jgi:hypothetical protein